MEHEKIREIFEKVQKSTSCHQKCVIKLTKIYQEHSRQEFLQIFMKFFKIVVSHKLENSKYVKRVISFVSKFCSDVTKQEARENETHEFLTDVLEQVLEWSCVNLYDVRYNCCFFMETVLQDIGDDVQFDINLIDGIQNVLLERMQEVKIPIRLTAMSALVRLQDPQNFECPVINAFSEALLSSSAAIRLNAIRLIAPNNHTVSRIKDRIRDVDPNVRAAAFQKVAEIGPICFRISERHLILLCGFRETNDKAKHIFLEYLLPKWFTTYEGNYIKFIGSLKLMADEEDIKKLTFLIKELLKEFYKKHPIENLISALPINDEKLIDVEQLTNEISIFWNILIKFLRESEHMDDYLNRIIPDLTPFCNYIERVVKTKSLDKMDEWKFFEYQFDLFNILEIAENYDYSDEVGRRTMQSLVITVLQSYSFMPKIVEKFVSIAEKCSRNIDIFTNDMCSIISEIREPLVEQSLSQDQRRELDFKEAELRVKINIIQENRNEAINERNYKKAQELEEQLKKCKQTLENLQADAHGEKVRVQKLDKDTLIRCLDVLASVLSLPAVSKMTPSLITCKDEFLLPLITNQETEVHNRVLKCLALYSIIDKATAEDYAKLLCVPIATYRTIPVNNITALVISINAIRDLISLYGIGLISNNEETEEANAPTDSKRKLYSTSSELDANNTKSDNMTLAFIFEIILDMLDDEREEIRYKAALVIAASIKELFPVTPTIISRIILKWCSPSTDSRLQTILGIIIQDYVRCKNSGDILKEAVLPTLNSIARAPKTSPLIDIDNDNLLLFFKEILSVTLEKDDIRILALDFCMKISETNNDRLLLLLTKFLTYLDIDEWDLNSVAELIERCENLLENVDKILIKLIEKFLTKLKKRHFILKSRMTNQTLEETNSNNDLTNNEALSNNKEKGTILKGQQIKRRKKKSVDNCVVILERLDLSKMDETKLHTIIEASLEMEVDPNLTVSDSLGNSPQKLNTVISETSDSDLNNGEVTIRKSMRCRKKRVF